MTLLDSNILGTFARVGRLSLLFDLFRTEPLGLTPAVLAEVQAGIEHGATFLQEVIDLVDTGQLALVSLTSEEVRSTLALPTSFGIGERDSVVVCQARGL
ncbi:MAG: hypothetical protein QME81_20865, partial [bacterium]|nr:hypothetical protein [bacterium]